MIDKEISLPDQQKLLDAYRGKITMTARKPHPPVPSRYPMLGRRKDVGWFFIFDGSVDYLACPRDADWRHVEACVMECAWRRIANMALARSFSSLGRARDRARYEMACIHAAAWSDWGEGKYKS